MRKDEEKWEIWRNKNAEIKKPYGGSVHKHIVWYEGVDRRKAFLDGLAEGRKDRNCINCSNHSSNLRKENVELKKEIKDLQTKDHIVPEHYLSEAIDRCNELKAQIDQMKNFVKSMYEANKNDAYCREYLGTILNEWS